LFFAVRPSDSRPPNHFVICHKDSRYILISLHSVGKHRSKRKESLECNTERGGGGRETPINSVHFPVPCILILFIAHQAQNRPLLRGIERQSEGASQTHMRRRGARASVSAVACFTSQGSHACLGQTARLQREPNSIYSSVSLSSNTLSYVQLRTQTHRDNKGTRADLWAVLRSVRLALFNEQLSLPRSYGLPQFAQRSVRL
jgi:hypothetical protein